MYKFYVQIKQFHKNMFQEVLNGNYFYCIYTSK